MKRFLLSACSLMALAVIAPAAHAAVEPNYAPDKPPVTMPWYAQQSAAERQADLDFITGMRPHHAGALTMSEAYLKDKNASYGPLKSLAKGIMHNQTFEIGMLDRVEELVKPPIRGESEWRQIAEKGLAQKQHFIRMPMPANFSDDVVTRRDVEFAKAMSIHHEGALMMAKDYLANPNATNKYLRLLCVDILADQTMEIGFMHDVVAKYPGNPDDVKIDASMIHGMDGMMGHMHGVEPAKKAKKSAAKAHKKPAAAQDHSAHGNTGTMDHGAMQGMDHSMHHDMGH